MQLTEPPEDPSFSDPHSSTNNINSKPLSCVDTTSLKIFIQTKPDNVDEDEKPAKAKPVTSKCQGGVYNSDSSSNCDEKEHLDKISLMAIGEKNSEKENGRSDFMTPKKISKVIEPINMNSGMFQ